MNNLKANINSPAVSSGLYTGSYEMTNYLYRNLTIEKKISLNWLSKLYKDSFFRDFWLLLSSPVD